MIKSGFLEFPRSIPDELLIRSAKDAEVWEMNCRRLERNRVGAGGIKGLGFRLKVECKDEAFLLHYYDMPDSFRGKPFREEALLELAKKVVFGCLSFMESSIVPLYAKDETEMEKYHQAFHLRLEKEKEVLMNLLLAYGFDSFIAVLFQLKSILHLTYILDHISFMQETREWTFSGECFFFKEGWTDKGHLLGKYNTLWQTLFKDALVGTDDHFETVIRKLVSTSSRIHMMKLLLNNLSLDHDTFNWSLPDHNIFNGHEWISVEDNELLKKPDIWYEILGKASDPFPGIAEEYAYRL